MNLPPIADVIFIVLIALASLLCYAQFATPRINGGEVYDSARLIKAVGFFLLAGWYGWRFYELGDVRISAVAEIAIALVALADIYSGISRLGRVAVPRNGHPPEVEHA